MLIAISVAKSTVSAEVLFAWIQLFRTQTGHDIVMLKGKREAPEQGNMFLVTLSWDRGINIQCLLG